MASTLRDELASLKIERPDPKRMKSRDPELAEYRRTGVGLRVLSWLLWMIPLGVVSGAGYVGYKQYDQMRSKPEVTVALVQRMTTGEAEKLLSAKGYLVSQHQSMIGTKLAGRVEEIRFKERDQVKAGQVLAVIEHHDLLAMIEQRKASMERAKAELEEARADLWEKDREAQRAERLVAKKMVPQEDYEKAASLKKMGVARVAALEASIKVMKANLDEMEYTRKYQMHLVAPFEGTVLKKEADVGEIVNPMAMSSSLGRSAVATIADLQNMDVETDITENQMWKIELGQPAEVSVSANPNKRYRGRLRQIIPMGDRTRGTVKVKVEILDPDDRLFPELAATVHFLPFKTGPQAEANKSYLFVPMAAVFQENGHDCVWVVDKKKSQVIKRQVEVATTREDLARVESGLNAEETVVVNPASTLRNNEVVRIPE
jgi:RND family efflux transporter MFP subunit